MLLKTRKAAILLISTILAIVCGVFVTSPASAATPTCYGDYCSNQDPQASHCAKGAWTQDAIDVYYAMAIPFRNTHYAGRLELRASNTCKTQWARFTSANSNAVVDIKVIQPSTGYRTDPQSFGIGESGWSNQVYSPNRCVFAWVDAYDLDSTSIVGPTESRTHCI